MLESNPSAEKATEVWRPYFHVRPFPYLPPHTLVDNALNSTGGMGAGPHYNLVKNP